MLRTKIVCTLGPATDFDAVLNDMFAAGMNIGRLNFSHGTHESHAAMIARFRAVRDSLNIPAAVMLDTKGPEIRVGNFEDGKIKLKKGETFTFTSRDVVGTQNEVSLVYKDLPRQAKPGMIILADDGKVSFEVLSADNQDITCKVVSAGELSNHKSLNVPNVKLDMPYLSEADKSDLLFGIEQDVDFIAASFARRKEDILQMRKFLLAHGGSKILIIAKIENIEGVQNFDEILSVSDGIMVARGDMGVEVPFEQLPGIQKMFIRKCYQSGKMVITATQMLESMTHSLMPTRAEISDVANAVFDGTSAIMLSGETATGDRPAHVVRTMAKIAEQAENDAFDMKAYASMRYDASPDITNAVSDAACTMAHDISAKAIIAVTKYGGTARRVSKFRPRQLIIASTPEIKTFHQLSLSWGVFPVLGRSQPDTDSLFAHAVECAKASGFVNAGDKVVITAGVPINATGTTNILKIQTVE